MAWAVENDIDEIVGDIPISSGISRTNFLNKAADEMNAYFSGIYSLPINIPASVASVISGATTNTLKSINQDLAGGWLLLSISSVHEDDSLHSFAKDLEKRALDKLKMIQANKMVLTGVDKDLDHSDNIVRPSKIRSDSPDGKSSNLSQTGSNATDDHSYFNRPIDEIGNPGFTVDL